MYSLNMSHKTARDIVHHAKEGYPAEVCGILAGTGSHVEQWFPISNVANLPRDQYEMNPTQLVKALKQIDNDNLDWIGVYHSHPTSPPILSQTDIINALDTKPLHLIISLQKSTPQLKLWRLSDDEIVPIDLIIGSSQIPNQVFHEPLSNYQKTVIIVASIICVIVMLSISISLLPPAPTITPIP